MLILIAGVDNFINAGSIEASTFFGVVFGVLALGLVLFLYVNRKWCFNTSNRNWCEENVYPTAKYAQKLARKRHYDNTSSDSDEDILRRLRLEHANNLQKGHQFHGYGLNSGNLVNPSLTNQHLNFNDLQRITITPRDSNKDPLAIAERGKVGVPSSQSECSSNDSIEASIDSNTGILTGEKKDRIQISQQLKSPNDNSASRIDNRSNRRSSLITRLPTHQDSIDEIPDINSNTNEDCIVVLSQEPLFDTSDLRSLKSEDIRPQSPSYGKSGTLEISLLYDAPMKKMTVHVLQARGIPSRDNGQNTHSQVRLLLLPNKKQKHKTKIRSGENPQYVESFLLHRVPPEEVNSMGLRIRVYGCERMRKERLIGESIVSFATIDLELETNLWLPLEPRNTSSSIGSSSDLLSLARSDSAGSTTSMQHGGVSELLLGLAYNGITGRLTVEIVKGSHFRSLALKAPDTYVKMCLVSSIGQEIARAKTSTRRGQPNPLFKESFAFQVALFQLNDVTLMISVYAKRSMKKNEMVGWFSLGLNSSGPEEVAHWSDMREMAKGEMLARWHILKDS